MGGELPPSSRGTTTLSIANTTTPPQALPPTSATVDTRAVGRAKAAEEMAQVVRSIMWWTGS